MVLLVDSARLDYFSGSAPSVQRCCRVMRIECSAVPPLSKSSDGSMILLPRVLNFVTPVPCAPLSYEGVEHELAIKRHGDL